MTNSSLFHSDINVNLSYIWLNKGTTPWAVIGLHSLTSAHFMSSAPRLNICFIKVKEFHTMARLIINDGRSG